MNTRTFLTAFVVASLSFGAYGLLRTTQTSAIPNWIHYQGRLTQPNGNLVPDGSYPAEFRIFDVPTGGTELWFESRSVGVKQGVFSASLGKATPFGQDLFEGPRWLEVKVDGKTLVPRQELAAVAFAIVASSLPADTVDSEMLQSDSESLAKVSGGIVRVAGSNVGIGTSNPQGPLHVANEGLRLDNGGRVDFGPVGSGTQLWDDTSGNRTLIRARAGGLQIVNQANSAYLMNVGSFGTEIWCADFSIGHPGRRGVPGRALVDNGSQLVLNYGADWPVVAVNSSLDVGGTLTKAAGSFKIDHPLDPENKYLYHSFVESPDMKNVYDGVAVLDKRGEAVVELPTYFEALNRDYRYQLTCIGAHSPVYVKREVRDNRFVIAGGRPGLKVSWQVTGIRQDDFANENRIVPEVDKPESERGRYLNARTNMGTSK